MSRRRPQLIALVLASSLLLAALPAFAQARTGARAHGPTKTEAADFIHLLWSSLSALWSSAPSPALTSTRGGEGGSLDPNGKPLGSGIAVVPTAPPDDEGASLDPDGHH